MQVVIDIPDEWKTRIEYNRRPNTIECGELVASIWRGKILPKNHGRLIDADALLRYTVIKFYTTNYFNHITKMIVNHITKMIDEAPTIIEADKEV